MLLKCTISNFYSVKDTITIDFESENIATERAKNLSDNVFSTQNEFIAELEKSR